MRQNPWSNDQQAGGRIDLPKPSPSADMVAQSEPLASVTNPWTSSHTYSHNEVMSVSDQLPLADVKNRLSEVVDQVESQHARVTITKHGRPAAVVISADDLASLEETLALLSDPGTMTQTRSSLDDVAAGKTTELTREEALALVQR